MPLLLWLALAAGQAQTYSVLHQFSGSDGSLPRGRLVLSGSTLYGTTSSGGSSGWGVAFKVSTDGSGYTVLKSFSVPDGANPDGLALAGNTLYGTTFQRREYQRR